MVVTIPERLVGAFEESGLSQYEARAYVALLRSGPVTGYQLSRLSGVPRSRIYEALEKLARRDMVMTQNDQPQRYSAANWEEVLEREAVDARRRLDFIRRSCASLSASEQPAGVWNLAGRAPFIARLRSMIQSAARSIAAVAPVDVFRGLEDVLARPGKKSRSIRLVTCGALSIEGVDVFQHAYRDGGCDDAAVVVDRREALVGEFGASEETTAAWSRERGFVHITEQYVLHEVFLSQALARLPQPAVRSLREMYEETIGRP